MLKHFCALTALFVAPPALADEPRDLCADRPGLGTPACTLDSGHVAIEVGIAGWTRDRQQSVRTDSVLLGDMLLRVGLGESLEGQIGWTAFGTLRERDRAAGTRDRNSGTGDVTLALRQNLRHPDGSGFALALMPYATLPAGGSAIGAGDWGAGIIVPMSVDLEKLSLSLSPEIDAAVDSDGDGRHLAYGAVAGLGFSLSESLSATAELSVQRDRDPAGHSTEALAGLSFAWQPGANSQWDIGVNGGLNRSSPDAELYFGYVRRF